MWKQLSANQEREKSDLNFRRSIFKILSEAAKGSDNLHAVEMAEEEKGRQAGDAGHSCLLSCVTADTCGATWHCHLPSRERDPSLATLGGVKKV